MPVSTNNTIIAFANGAAAASSPAGAVEEIDKETDRESYEIFKKVPIAFSADLAKLVVRVQQSVLPSLCQCESSLFACKPVSCCSTGWTYMRRRGFADTHFCCLPALVKLRSTVKT